jgi:L-alanine-DL-glutamate epimerase-like enolase superfamily enzyme
MRIEARPLSHALKSPFGLSRWTLQRAECVLVELRDHAGNIGLGEGAPNARYGESVDSALAVLSTVELTVPSDLEAARRQIVALSSGAFADQRAALSALDMALLDLLGKRCTLPLCELLELPSTSTPQTSFTISLSDPETMAEQAKQAARVHRLLKIKLGSADLRGEQKPHGALQDRQIIAAIRKHVDLPLMVDANEGWRDEKQALEMIRFLADQGVTLVEQPLCASTQSSWLKQRSPLPLFADEACVPGADLAELSAAYDGVNIKLDKEGGLGLALAAAKRARETGLKLLVGCMVSSSLAITAAAHVATLADHADLDGQLLIVDDPFDGASLDANGHLHLRTERSGLGAEPRA